MIGSVDNSVDRNYFAVARDEKSRTDAESGQKPGQQLDEKDRKKVEELKKRDEHVRQHEQSHLAAAGGHARGGPTYSYTQGPDGKRYAVGGEVSIDISKGRTPEETIQKARTVRAAALAPADPSGQDRSVAAAATKMETEARRELAEKAKGKDTAGTGKTEVQGETKAGNQSRHISVFA